MKKKSIRQKEEEYTNIKWDQLADAEVQKAVIIYNDRVLTYRKMVEIDAVIDEHPTEKRVMDLAELRDRNLMAFGELESYNKTGKWLNRHPLLKHFSLHAQLEEMLRRNPAEFLGEYAKTSGYVNRYRSYINNQKRTTEQKENDLKNLKKYNERERIIKEVMEGKGN